MNKLILGMAYTLLASIGHAQSTLPALYGESDTVAACGGIYRQLGESSSRQGNDSRTERIRAKHQAVMKHLDEIWPQEVGFHRDTTEHLIRATNRTIEFLELVSVLYSDINWDAMERFCDESVYIPILEYQARAASDQ